METATRVIESLRPQLEQIPFFNQPRDQMIWHQNHVEIPVFALALYLWFVFRGPQWMEKKQAWGLKIPLALWNLSLALFSWVGAFCTVPVLWRALQEHGVRFTVCASPFDWSANFPSGLFVGIFIYSKFPELLDTVFLILRKRPVIFLHWYHHVTVLLFCWHAWHTAVGYGIWFASINYSVHALMYSYYFCTNIGLYPVVRHIAPLITTLQLSQMFLGLAILFTVAYYRSTATVVDDIKYGGVTGFGYHPEACYADDANLKLGLAMYGSYFMLFAFFFYEKYIAPSPSKGGHDSKKEK